MVLMSSTKADVSSHPIYRSVEDALRAFQVYEKSQETVLEDDGAQMKASACGIEIIVGHFSPPKLHAKQ